MKNLVIFNKMLEQYEQLSYTNKYIFGFSEKNVIYCVITNEKVLPLVCTLDKASRGQGYALRFKPTNAQKNLLKMENIFPLCSVDFFNSIANSSKYNKGEIFEKLVTEYFGQEWTKDNIPFTESGDIIINNIHYQIKFEKATFTNEKSLTRMWR